MFICEPCHQNTLGTSARALWESRSHGPCEVCLRVGECFECSCYKTPDSTPDPVSVPVDELVADLQQLREELS